jgi:hypothetical protein
LTAACADCLLPADRLRFQQEISMRMKVLAIAAIGAGAMLAPAMPAQAQTYDPSYPVCLHVYGRATYYECRYTSLPQCQATASGRSAQCEINPYYAQASEAPSSRRYKRQRQIY